MFTNFIANLEPLRYRTARFRRVVLHLHSIESHDWAKSAINKEANLRSNFEGEGGQNLFLDKLRISFDCVGVTDHMKCTYATQLSDQTVGDQDFIVLPGMEINFSLEPLLGLARIHLLVLLKEGGTPADFACLFTNINDVPNDDLSRKGHEVVSGINLKNFVSRVHGEGGICIAAHVNNQQGIRHCFRQSAKDILELISEENIEDAEKTYEIPNNFKQLLLDSDIDAIEIHKTRDVCHYRWESELDGSYRSIATILTSDAHCIEDFQRTERTTHIKMTRIGLKGLKEALRFPDTRIRFPDNLPTPPSPRILGIQVSGSDNSFFEDVTIAFAENLNCLIGVRGSGKSTIVEAMRYVFGYNLTLNELDKLQTSIRELQRVNLTDSIIRVAYRKKSGEIHVLEATFDPQEDYVTKVFSASGDPIAVANVEKSGDYPMRLFGWSELEILGREPAKQRDLLDRLILEIPEILERRKSIRDRLKVNHASIVKCVQDVKATFEQNGRMIERYLAYKSDFAKLNTIEVKGLFSSLDIVQEKLRILLQLQLNTDVLISSLDGGKPVSLRGELESLLTKGSEELRRWWHEEELGHLGIVTVESEIQAQMNLALEKAKAFRDLLSEHIKQIETQIGGLQKNLRERLISDDATQKIADLRANAETRLRQASAIRDNYLKKWEVMMKAIEDRKAITIELVKVQNEIAGIRTKNNQSIEETLNRFLPDDMHVSIDFKAGHDTKEYGKILYSIFGAKSFFVIMEQIGV